MTIHAFDTRSGYYAFSESDLQTLSHAHSAWEFIVAREGRFSLLVGERLLEDLSGAIIQPHITHMLMAEGCNCDFFLMEPFYAGLNEIQAVLAESFTAIDPVCIPDAFLAAKLADRLRHLGTLSEPLPIYDERVERCIQFINDHIQDFQIRLAALAQVAHLSPGRLSHLFKAQVGLPIQKFIIWSRLKVVIAQVITKGLTLTEAAYSGGFYDSAHFSKYFKEIFGLPPSAVYNNSRIVQASDGAPL